MSATPRTNAALYLAELIAANSARRLREGQPPTAVAADLEGLVQLIQALSQGEYDPSGVSIPAARKYVHSNLVDGVHCPVCEQLCKLYPRKIYGEVAAWLIWLVRAYKQVEQWYSVHDGPVLRGGDYAKLEGWGLIVARPNDDPTKRTSGFWKPTQLGIDFVHCKVAIPRTMWIYDSKIHAFSEDKVLIIHTLGESFDYTELMEGRGFRWASSPAEDHVDL